jgi:flagellar hook assembly protein FlgD
VYPNPVSGNCWFTFSLNRAARVEIDIHSISGRLVRRIENQDCQLGYNQVSWDGADAQGVRLPNGIYLYRLLAQSSDASSGANRQTSDQVLEKFIVKR